MEADFQNFVVNLNYGVKSPDWSAHCCQGNRINNPLPWCPAYCHPLPTPQVW